MKGITRELGIDPRSENARDFSRLMTSLDPDSLSTVRQGILSASQQAQPGQMVALARGVFSGQVPIDQLITYAQQTRQAPEPQVQNALYVAGEPLTPTQVQMPGGTGAPEVPQPPLPVAPQYREGTTAPRHQEIAPELAAVLGLNPQERQRNIDVILRTHPSIPTDYAGQQRLAQDIREQRLAMVRTMAMATELAGLIEGHPEALSLVINLPSWAGGRTPLNTSRMVQAGRDVASGWSRLFTGDTAPVPPAEELLSSARARHTVAVLARRFARLSPTEEPEGGRTGFVSPELARTERMARTGEQLEGARERLTQAEARVNDPVRLAAVRNARIESILAPLAYAMATAKGQAGRGLSDQDLLIQLQELGSSGSPEVFTATLRDVVRRTYETYAGRMTALTGGTVPIELGIGLDDMQRLIASPFVPPQVRTALQQQLDRAGQTPQAPAPETLQGPEAPGGGVTVRRVPTVPIGPGAQPPGTQAPPEPAPSTPRQRGTEGSMPTIQQQEATELALAQEQIQHQRRAWQIQEDANERARRADERAARGEIREIEELRRRRIQEAFGQIAASLRSGGGNGSMGTIASAGAQDQDAAAFRATPPPQRRPPVPVDASRFMRR